MMKCPECDSSLIDQNNCHRCGWSNKQKPEGYEVKQHINSTGDGINVQAGRDVTINIPYSEANKAASRGPQPEKTKDSSSHYRISSKAHTGEIKVFLSYAKEDGVVAEKIFLGLQRRGLKIWKDDKSLRVGDVFDNKITHAIKESDFAIILLSSKSVSKIGYIQKELRQILEMSQFRPHSTAFVLPIKLDDCQVPLEIADFNWIEFNDDEELFMDRLNYDIRSHRSQG